MNTGVSEFCQFCQALYKSLFNYIYLFILMTVYTGICFYSLYDKTDKMTKVNATLKINALSCHEEKTGFMTEMTKVLGGKTEPRIAGIRKDEKTL